MTGKQVLPLLVTVGMAAAPPMVLSLFRGVMTWLRLLVAFLLGDGCLRL